MNYCEIRVYDFEGFLWIDYEILLSYDGVFLVVVSPVVAGRMVLDCVPCSVSAVSICV